jgi:hypothetical protein
MLRSFYGFRILARIILLSRLHIVLHQWVRTSEFRRLADSPFEDRTFPPESAFERLLQFVGGATDGLIER